MTEKIQEANTNSTDQPSFAKHLAKLERREKLIYFAFVAPLLVYLALFFIYPLLSFLPTSFFYDGGFSFDKYMRAFTKPVYLRILRTSFIIAGSTTLITLVLAYPVAYLFTKTGIVSFADGVDEDQVMEAALEAGAEDVIANDDGSIDVLTQPENFPEVKAALDQAGLKADVAEVTMRAATSVDVGIDDAQQVARLVDMLEDLDDVQNVYSNADFSEDVMAALSS